VIRANRVLAVNALGAGDEALSALFAESQRSMEERFGRGRWFRQESGSPILESSLVAFDCETEHTMNVGTHSLILCRIVAIVAGRERAPLLYRDRA
jgi:flavin reductase